MKRILAIHAHPDDVEILAGGTLALLAAAGHDVIIATMTAGDCGSAEHTAEQIAAIRLAEAAASASLIQAQYWCCGFSDLRIFNDDVSRKRVTEVLRRAKPDVVITASPVDYMADHEMTSALVKDACFAAPVALYRTDAAEAAPPLPRIPHLYYVDPLTGMHPDGTPVPSGFCVDITPVFQFKKAMLAQHESQRNWLRKHHGMDDYLLQMEASTRAAGERFGVRYGEGFRRYVGHAYPQSPLLEELLGASVITRNGG